MYLAELRGKLSRRLSKNRPHTNKLNYEESEDILTSNVFGFLKYANRKVYLGRFLHDLKLDLSDIDLEEAVFQFWPTYQDGTEPDVIIIAGRYYILVEAKKNAGFGIATQLEKNQLNREYLEGMKEAEALGKEFILLAITGDSSLKLSKFDKTLHIVSDPCFRWTSWQKFATLLQKILDQPGKKVTDRLLAADLYALLERKNLREFRSFNDLDFPFRPVRNVFFSFETAVFRGDFIGFQRALPSFKYSKKTTPHFFIRERFKGLNSKRFVVNPPEQVFYQRKDG
ncbi:MAG: hypothetical protein SCK57_03750 [Bacillota bacterium]|nr:hypothetical protein [Bacillota bacterium]MDW7676753.1 hypothetical protein [Bacillota bacterium]